MKMTKEQYDMHCRDYDGYCTECDEVTRFGDTEPDAEGYECPDCDQDTCHGIEQSLVAGYIEIVTEEELDAEVEESFTEDEEDES